MDSNIRIDQKPAKPLGIKAYGSIGHLPNSRIGPGDHMISPGQAHICCEFARDKHDIIYVQEKLDGSCTAVTRISGELIALNRAGYPAASSPWEMHHLFADWVKKNASRFKDLPDGVRVVGEWLAQAHGTRYALHHEPWVVFDIMEEHKRRLTLDVISWAEKRDFTTPTILHVGPPISIEAALQHLGEHGHHGAIDPAEGCVWRVERKGKVDFLAKWVRPDKQDGCYLPEISGEAAIWNWLPATQRADSA